MSLHWCWVVLIVLGSTAQQFLFVLANCLVCTFILPGYRRKVQNERYSEGTPLYITQYNKEFTPITYDHFVSPALWSM